MGIVIGVVVAVVLVGFLFALVRGGGGGGSAPRVPPGTKAFESEVGLGIIAKMIEAREIALAGSPDDAKRAQLEKDISNLRKQAQLHRAVVDRGDVSRGKMSIGVNPDRDTID